MLAVGFWGPVGLWLMIHRGALTVLASVPVDGHRHVPGVTVVIPARNEERNLQQALQSVLALDYPDLEIVVINDRSTDGTGHILARMAEGDPRVTVLTGEDPPTGWLGKPYALHTGAQRARGEFILFTDADIVFHPLALRKAMAHLQANGLDHVTVVPEDTMPGVFLKVFSATFGMFLFMVFAPWNARNPKSRRYMGIGAFHLIRTSVYRALGGHQRVALRPDEDLKFGKLVKGHGYGQDVMDGNGMVAVEWYRSVSELRDGLMKNMFAGMDYSVLLATLATGASLVLHLWPWVGVWVADGWPRALYAATVVMMVGSFGFTMGPWGVRYRHGLLLPFTIGMLVYVQCRAMVLTLWQGGIVWRGRFYALALLRKNRV